MSFKISAPTKIGVTVFFAIAIFIWGINYLKGIDIFKQANEYYLIYEKVDGLVASSPVLINGLRIGQVRDINFHEDGSGRLVVEIASDTKYKIPKNSTGRIFSSDLLGTRSIEIVFSDSATYHVSGDTLRSDIEESLAEQVSLQMLPLKNKAEDLLEDIEVAMQMIQKVFNEETQENLTKSFESIKKTVDNLESTSYMVDTLVKNEKEKLANIFSNVESITSNLKSNNENLSLALDNIVLITDSLAKSELKSTIANTNKAIKDVEQIMSKINSGEGSIGMLINNDTLYYNLEDAAYNLNKLVEDLRINPKRYIHFSLFDLGRTVYEVDENLNTKNEIGNDKVEYRIQIRTSNTPIPLHPDNFKELKNVEEFLVSGTYIYTVGKKNEYEKIIKDLNEVKVKYPDAFIVAFKAGVQIEIKK
jgi:phospholipid/cholesterol/gamma-HCH transport system substrate-binding protein